MQANWYFDFISPFSYLQLARLPRWRERVEITPVPIAFGAVLASLGTLGPAEIPGRREFTYRFVQWQAERAGIVLRFPPAHPFNPLAALRLCIAAGSGWNAVQVIFDHIWREGRPGASPQDLAAAGAALGVEDVHAATSSATVKEQLTANTRGAIADGVFGVPTLRIGSELFWGNDASPMIEDWLAQGDRFEAPEYRRLAGLPVGIERRR